MRPFPLFTLALFLAIPSLLQADFGSRFTVNSRMSTALDSTDKKISFRFTCQNDMSAIAISVFCERAVTPPAYLFSLREDVKGLPSAKILESSSLTPGEKGWMTVPFNEAPLFKGKTYHLVVEQDINRGGEHPVGIIGPRNFSSFSFTDFPNAFYPREETPDPKMNVLVFENGKWETLNRQPLFAVFGSGNNFQGNPYDEFRALPIHGNATPENRSDDVLQGQALHPHYGIHPLGFILRVKKRGNPHAPLNYRVYSIDHLHHKTTPAFSGEALKPQEVSTLFQWVTIGFKPKDSPVDFPPECRYVVFQTDSGKADGTGGCEDCYLLSEVGNSGGLFSAADLGFDGGAHLSRAVHSEDGWATWIDDFERDANVLILCPPGARPVVETAKPIPTPEPILRNFP